MRRAVVVLLVAALLPGCASTRTRGGAPLPGIRVSEADAVWPALVEARQRFGGALSNARVRVEQGTTNRSFRATIQIDRDGDLLLNAVTPLGTTAFTLAAVGDRIVVINPSADTYWEGTRDGLARELPLFAGERSMREMALLLIGLPPTDDAGSYQTGPAGLTRATAGGMDVEYAEPGYPPSRVIVRSGAARVTVEHLDVIQSADAVEIPPTGGMQRVERLSL